MESRVRAGRAQIGRGRNLTLCQIAGIPDGGAKGVDIGSGDVALDLIVLRRGSKVFAYLNRCPHQGTPLETFPDKFLDPSRNLLICSTHGARFRVRDGVCVAGPCKGASLKRVPVEVSGGTVTLLSANSLGRPGVNTPKASTTNSV